MDHSPEKTDGIACVLDGRAYRTRVARIHALMDQTLIARESLEVSVRMRFRRDAGVEADLEELVALERKCCPFLVFALQKRSGEMVLTISGPEGTSALLDEAFGGLGMSDGEHTSTPAPHGMGCHGWGIHRRVWGGQLLCAAVSAGHRRSGDGHRHDHYWGMGRAVRRTGPPCRWHGDCRWIYPGLSSATRPVRRPIRMRDARPCRGDESGALAGADSPHRGDRCPIRVQAVITSGSARSPWSDDDRR
jgi:hypothetical protein